MTIPNTYRKSRENVIKSYNFQDLAAGTGTVVYYAFQANKSSGYENLLSPNLIQCGAQGGSTFGVIKVNQELDFDLSPFNLPQTIKGDVYVIATAAAAVSSVSMEAQVKKWDGSTETNISDKITSFGINNAGEYCTLRIPVNQVSFKKGEILRVTIKAVGGDAAARLNLTTETKTLKVLIPYKIEQ